MNFGAVFDFLINPHCGQSTLAAEGVFARKQVVSFFFSTGRTVQAGWEQHIISLDFLHPQTSVQGTFKFTVNYSNIMLISLHLATFPKPSRVPAF